jgi:hypothetical protein
MSATTTALLERSLAISLFHTPSVAAECLAEAPPSDFSDAQLACLVEVVAMLQEDGKDVTLATVSDEMERRSPSANSMGCAALIAEIADDFPDPLTNPIDLAKRVHRCALERELRTVLEHRAVDPGDLHWKHEQARIEGELDEKTREENQSVRLDTAGFAGARIRALRDRPQPDSPLPGILDPEAHLHVMLGKTKTGKTTYVLNMARAWALRCAPWPGAPALPGSRVLVLSREQSVTRIDSTLRRLSIFADSGGRDAWPDRMTIIARDRELPSEGRRLLTLDDGGLGALRAGLMHAREIGDPYGLVVLDSLSRLKPDHVEERDNDGLTPWLDALEDVASTCGAYVVLIHHVGHTSDPTRGEARTAGRGASAISAVAQAVWLLERVPENPHLRRLEVDGNAILPAEIFFEVSGEGAEPGAINYFRRTDPIGDADPTDYLGEEAISTSALAWRIAGKQPTNGERPPGKSVRRANQLRESWLRQKKVEVFEGARGAIMIRLARAGNVQ